MILSCVIADHSLDLQKQYSVALSRTPRLRLKETVTCGPELEECLERGNIHLILLDIYLKGWEGVASLRQARIRYPRIDWLVLSKGADPDIVRGCVCLGVFDYLIKPFPPERLERALNTFFQYHQGLTQRTNPWHQKDLDMITALRNSPSRFMEETPKGIQGKLLDRFRTCMRRTRRTMSSAEVGKATGVSRSTARRYLEHLVERGEASFEYEISNVGRPVKLYIFLD